MDNNRLDYRFHKSTTAAARGTKNHTPGASFGGFRLFEIGLNTALMNEYKQMEDDKAEYAKDHNARAIFEYNAKLDSAFHDVVVNRQRESARILDKLIDSKKSAITKFTQIPPREENIRKIELADKRFDSMSDVEFRMLVADCADNFQESAYLHNIAVQHGKTYALPYEPGESFEQLEELKKRLTDEVITHIGEDVVSNPGMNQFFRCQDGREIYGRINELCAYFDNLPVTLAEEPLPELSSIDDINDRLVAARRKAYANNLTELWHECINVSLDIQKTGINSTNLMNAERLIKIIDQLYPDGVDKQ